MKQCKCCKNYIKEESSFCPYCGKKLWKAVTPVELKMLTTELSVETESYKSKGEEKSRYVFYLNRDKISSFVPDFAAKVKQAWLIGDEQILFLTAQQNVVKLRSVGINKKNSTEICQFPKAGPEYADRIYLTDDGSFLFTGRREYGKPATLYMICGQQVVTYSVDADVHAVELYSDHTIVCNQGTREAYVAWSDGSAKAVSSMYSQEELCRRYYRKCLEIDRYFYPKMIDDMPSIKSQTIDMETGDIFVTVQYGQYRDGNPEEPLYEYQELKYRNEETFFIEADEELPIEEGNPVIMEASEWETEEADIRHIEKLAQKDDPKREVHQKLYAFYNLSENYLYGTGEKEQFLYDRKNRMVCFFPATKYKSGQDIVDQAVEYTKKHPEKILFAANVERMHLLDSVTEKLIRAQEERLQPFLVYMKDAKKYAAAKKGIPEYDNIIYMINQLIADVDMVIGVCYTNAEGQGRIGWTEQDVMYTEQATGMVVRMNTTHGKKIVHIPLGRDVIRSVRMTEDVQAKNRSEWYEALKGTWKDYVHEVIPLVPDPYSTTNVCSSAVNDVEMKAFMIESSDYNTPSRFSIKRADLMYSPDGYRLEPDKETGNFYYKTKDINVPVTYLTNIHLYTLNPDGIYYIKNHTLYFHGKNGETKKYEGCFRDTVRLYASRNYIFVESIKDYTEGKSYDSCGDTMYITEFTVNYNTIVLNSKTGERVALWSQTNEITQLYQWDNMLTIRTGEIEYDIPDNDEGIQLLSDPWKRREKEERVLTKENMGESYSLIEKYGVWNFVGLQEDGGIRMVVDGAYRVFDCKNEQQATSDIKKENNQIQSISIKSYIEKRGRLSAKEGIAIAIRIAGIMKRAYQKGMTHGALDDLNNVTLTTKGEVQILNFNNNSNLKKDLWDFGKTASVLLPVEGKDMYELMKFLPFTQENILNHYHSFEEVEEDLRKLLVE